jgi:hypothetical protein
MGRDMYGYMHDRVAGCGGEFDVCMCVGFAGIEVHRGIKGGGVGGDTAIWAVCSLSRGFRGLF